MILLAKDGNLKKEIALWYGAQDEKLAVVLWQYRTGEISESECRAAIERIVFGVR